MDVPGVANLTGIVVSVLALGFSGWSLIYARQATRTAAASELRAATPKLTGALVEALAEDRQLRVLNEGPTDLDEVTVEIVSGGGTQFTPSVSSLSADRGPRGRSVDLGIIRVGESRDLRLWRIGPLAGELRVRCHCRVGKRSWVILIAVDLSSQ